MLDNIDGEMVRETSIVRYAPGVHFPRHPYGGGTEIRVLEGTFCDDLGEYRPGVYLRNPPGSSNAPHTKDGCVLFVKLSPFAADDERRVLVDTVRETWPARALGVHSLSLHRYGAETVRIEHWIP